MRIFSLTGLWVGLSFAIGCFILPPQAAAQASGPAATEPPGALAGRAAAASAVLAFVAPGEARDEQPDPPLVQAAGVTLADLVEACVVDPGPALGRLFCNETVGAAGDAVESGCLALRETGQINCEAAGPHAELLSALSARCEWAYDPVFKDRLGNPMRGRAIACR